MWMDVAGKGRWNLKKKCCLTFEQSKSKHDNNDDYNKDSSAGKYIFYDFIKSKEV